MKKIILLYLLLTSTITSQLFGMESGTAGPSQGASTAKLADTDEKQSECPICYYNINPKDLAKGHEVFGCNPSEEYPEGLPTGGAIITSGGKLPAKYVIHTVGPRWKGGDHDEEKLL